MDVQEQDRKKDYERMLENVKDDKSTHVSRHRIQLQEVGCKRIAMVHASPETVRKRQEEAAKQIGNEPLTVRDRGLVHVTTQDAVATPQTLAVSGSIVTVWTTEHNTNMAMMLLTEAAFHRVFWLGVEESKQQAVAVAAAAATEEATDTPKRRAHRSSMRVKRSKTSGSQEKEARHEDEKDNDTTSDASTPEAPGAPDRIMEGMEKRARVVKEEYFNPSNYLTHLGMLQVEPVTLRNEEEAKFLDATVERLKRILWIKDETLQQRQQRQRRRERGGDSGGRGRSEWIDIGVDKKEFMENMSHVAAYAFPLEQHLRFQTIGWCLSNQFGFLNHSCRPNAFVLHGFKAPMAMTRDDAEAVQKTSSVQHSMDTPQYLYVAAAPLAPGKEITVSYMPFSYWNPRPATPPTRSFGCQCGACWADPMVLDLQTDVDKRKWPLILSNVASYEAKDRSPDRSGELYMLMDACIRSMCQGDLHPFLHPFEYWLTYTVSLAMDTALQCPWPTTASTLAPGTALPSPTREENRFGFILKMLVKLLLVPRVSEAMQAMLRGEWSTQATWVMNTLLYVTFGRALRDVRFNDLVDTTKFNELRPYETMGQFLSCALAPGGGWHWPNGTEQVTTTYRSLFDHHILYQDDIMHMLELERNPILLPLLESIVSADVFLQDLMKRLDVQETPDHTADSATCLCAPCVQKRSLAS